MIKRAFSKIYELSIFRLIISILGIGLFSSFFHLFIYLYCAGTIDQKDINPSYVNSVKLSHSDEYLVFLNRDNKKYQYEIINADYLFQLNKNNTLVKKVAYKPSDGRAFLVSSFSVPVSGTYQIEFSEKLKRLAVPLIIRRSIYKIVIPVIIVFVPIYILLCIILAVLSIVLIKKLVPIIKIAFTLSQNESCN